MQRSAWAFTSSSVPTTGTTSARRAISRATWARRAGGSVGRAACISAARRGASRISSEISRASGRFFQYFFGISDCIARTISRAGLKIEA
ncbi:hypothetical protein GCM10017056_39330 [Seohaeicola zhoushanensis]|uniref:Uncharacterized protein n=1 Tax=Seohaeicola zhoushanensis TaxID=1569283 RepID=A0A8J3H1G4_9RHOB|nr:hypothetical protein GCM10017056_39330 [Seohaeicola zhoushanensis]